MTLITSALKNGRPRSKGYRLQTCLVSRNLEHSGGPAAKLAARTRHWMTLRPIWFDARPAEICQDGERRILMMMNNHGAEVAEHLIGPPEVIAYKPVLGGGGRTT